MSRAVWLVGSLLERREFDATPGNGSLAWLAPIPMYLIHDGARAKEIAAEMSRTAHEETEAVDASRYLTGLMVGALRSESKEALLSDLYSPVYNYWLFQHVALCPAVDRVARGVYKDKQESELPATDKAPGTLEAALWAFHGTSDFEEGALRVVSLGGGSDSAAAVYGQLAGSYYGDANIPMRWREKVARRKEIEDLAITVMHETKQGIRHFT
jgi:ADP-ribosylglycohydrolase